MTHRLCSRASELRSPLARGWSLSLRCALLLLFMFTACSEDGPSDDSSLPDDVSAEIGKEGGTLKSKGITLMIPKDALDAPVTITITDKGLSAPGTLKVKQVSNVHEFGPKGTKFKKEVQVTFHTDKDDAQAVVYFTKENSEEEFEQISSDKRPGAQGKGADYVATTTHFSEGFVGVPLADEFDASLSEPDASVEMESDSGSPSEDAAVEPDGSVPVVSKHIVVQSKDRFGFAVNQTWAAYQDGDGAWMPLAPSAVTGTYEFDITSDRYGVAFVCAETEDEDSNGMLYYAPATKDTLDVVTYGPACTKGVKPGTHVLQGIASIGAATYLRYGHEGLSEGISETGNPSYAVTLLPHDVASDILFGRSTTADTGLTRVLFARDMKLTEDINGFYVLVEKDGSDVGAANAAVLGANADTTVQVLYATRGAQTGMSLAQAVVTGTSVRTLPFATLPESIRRPDDRYLLVAEESGSTSWRKATLASYPSADLALTMPAALTATLSAIETPNWRPVYTFEDRPGTQSYVLAFAFKPARDVDHSFNTIVDPGWLEAGSEHTVTFPDLSGVQGFVSTWMPSGAVENQSLNYSVASVSVTETAAGTLRSEVGARGSLSAQ